jgi:hypothetical protein
MRISVIKTNKQVKHKRIHQTIKIEALKVSSHDLPGSSQTNIVRKNSSIVDIVVTVNGIDPINHRNAKTGG